MRARLYQSGLRGRVLRYCASMTYMSFGKVSGPGKGLAGGAEAARVMIAAFIAAGMRFAFTGGQISCRESGARR